MVIGCIDALFSFSVHASLPAVEETIFGQFWIGHVDQTTELVLNIDDSVHVRQTVRHWFDYDIGANVAVEHLMAVSGAGIVLKQLNSALRLCVQQFFW